MMDVCNILTNTLIGPSLASMEEENRALRKLLGIRYVCDDSQNQSANKRMRFHDDFESKLLLEEIENISTISS